MPKDTAEPSVKRQRVSTDGKTKSSTTNVNSNVAQGKVDVLKEVFAKCCGCLQAPVTIALSMISPTQSGDSAGWRDKDKDDVRPSHTTRYIARVVPIQR